MKGIRLRPDDNINKKEAVKSQAIFPSSCSLPNTLLIVGLLTLGHARATSA